jgi:hypothetical protein
MYVNVNVHDFGCKRLTKSQSVEKPIKPPASMGATKEMLGKDVHLHKPSAHEATNKKSTYANQKKEMANSGAAYIPNSNRNSGGTGCGAYFTTSRSY